eukprot:sb/3472017/
MPFFSYSDLLTHGILDSEPNACHYLISKKIIPTRRTCQICFSDMAIKSCSTTQYSDGFCWTCTCGNKISVRQHSILENKQTPFRTFIGILSCYSSRMTPAIAAQQQHLDQRTVKQYYTMIREKMRKEIDTSAGKTLDTTESAWLKLKEATSVSETNRLFSCLLPDLLYYRNWC